MILSSRDIIEASDRVADNAHFAHHLAIAAAERWFQFELAAELNANMADHVALLERSGAKVDILVVPKHEALRGKTLGWKADSKTSASERVVIELKAVHLSDGDDAYTLALKTDLVAKPMGFAGDLRGVKMFGVQISTDGWWGGPPNEQTKSRAMKVAREELPLAPGLRRCERLSRPVRYDDWYGTVWVEVLDVGP